MRAVVLLFCFVLGSGAGAWLGYVLALVSGITSADLPLSLGGALAVTALAIGALAGLSVLVRRVAGAGIEPPGRARAEGRGARNSVLFAATFFAFTVVFAVFAQISPLSLFPAALVTLLLSLAAVRRGTLLRLAAICVGVLYVLACLVVSLARAF